MRKSKTSSTKILPFSPGEWIVTDLKGTVLFKGDKASAMKKAKEIEEKIQQISW